MISLRIAPADIAGSWRFQDGGWRSGGSVVSPFAHPAIESFAVEASDATLIVARENRRRCRVGLRTRAPAGDDADRCLERLLDWPLNVNVVRLPRLGGPVTIGCGEAATAPLFLTVMSGALAGEWDIAELFGRMPVALDFAKAAHALCWLGLPYSKHTIYPAVLHLTERSRAHWNPTDGELDIAYPGAAMRHAPRRLAAGADVHSAFETLFGSIVRRAAGAAGSPLACELSGGLDSGVATIVCARTLGPDRVRSFGLLLPGAQQAAQAARRDSVSGLLGVADTAFAAEAPFCRGGCEDDPAVPWGEYYREGFRQLGQAMSAAGCTLLVRGIGGDEISEIDADEEEPAPTAAVIAADDDGDEEGLPDYLTDAARSAAQTAYRSFKRAPPGFAAASFYQSAAASAPVYLRRGIWPVYPYGTRELVAFCQSLPTEWRADRTLQRSYLAKAGLPPEVVRPSPPESFLPLRDLMFEEPSATHVRAMFENPILAELGLVDPVKLAAAFERATADPAAPGRTRLLEAATMESMLRTWRRRSAQGP